MLSRDSNKKNLKINNPEKGINLHFFTKNQIIKLIKKKKFVHACHATAFYHFLLFGKNIN